MYTLHAKMDTDTHAPIHLYTHVKYLNNRKNPKALGAGSGPQNGRDLSKASLIENE